MITNSPNPEDIGVIAEKQQIEEYIQKVQFGNGSIVKATDITEIERIALERVSQQERATLLQNMRSKNKTAQRRAKKKIADASKRRNRK